MNDSDPRMTEYQILAKAQAIGKWGFSIDYLLTGGQDLLTTQVPVWAARPWVVQLNGFKYQRGNLQPTLNSVNPDGQTATLVRARVFFGTDAVAEEVVVDYPFSGCSFAVHGALVRVRVDPPAEAFSAGITLPPMLGGTLSPGSTARGAVSQVAGATFTTQIPAIAPAQTIIVNIPRRAVAYQVMYTAQTLATTAIQVSETVGQGANTFVAYDYGLNGGGGEELGGQGIGGGSGTYFVSQYRARDWIRLLPQANTLTVQNTGGAPTSLQVQFLLDLG